MSGGRVVPDVLAAVDLGSNSFHMVVARHSHGQLVILDRLREMVRLAGGLSDSGRLDDAATDRALRCLERFGQRLRDMQAAGPPDPRGGEDWVQARTTDRKSVV